MASAHARICLTKGNMGKCSRPHIFHRKGNFSTFERKKKNLYFFLSLLVMSSRRGKRWRKEGGIIFCLDGASNCGMRAEKCEKNTGKKQQQQAGKAFIFPNENPTNISSEHLVMSCANNAR